MRLALILLFMLCTFRVMTCKECGMPGGMHRMDCSRYQHRDRVAGYSGKGFIRTGSPSVQYRHSGNGGR